MDYRDIDLTGNTGPIYFRAQDSFRGIELVDLLSRLRLDPSGSPVDLMAGVSVYLDGEEVPLPDSSTIDDVDDLMGEAPQDGLLVSADNGDIVSGEASLKGGWLVDWFWEVRHEATWLGEVIDPRAVALKWLRERAVEWYVVDTQREFNVDCPYLDPAAPADQEMLRSLVDLGVRVTLNSVAIVPTVQM